MPRDDVLILDIVIAAADAQSFVRNLDWAAFQESRLHQSAVIRALEVVGEAASRLSSEFTSAHPELPWRDIVNMRHRLIHAYSAVRLDIVWDVTQNQLQEILAKLTPLIPKDDQTS
jgi:uncharacterized protein with HEPN domain